MEEREEEIKQGSETEEDMDNWRILVPDTGNTRGRITQFKQTLYLNWLMKSLLGKGDGADIYGYGSDSSRNVELQEGHGENSLPATQTEY